MHLVERDAEYSALDELISGVALGRSGLVVVEGPPGAGKSALLAALPARADEVGVTVVAARATELGRDVPFGLARRLLERSVRATPGVLEAGWARHARPVFEGSLNGAGSAAPLVEGLVAVVAELARARAIAVLAVDDAQWADPPSLAFLTELAGRGNEVGVGLAVGIRTGEAGGDEAPLRRLRAAPGARTVVPAPFSPAAVRALVAARLPEAGDAFASRLAEASGGNPLLVTELLSAAVRSGAAELTLPGGVARTVLLRVEDLAPESRALAEAVAILGETPLRLAAELAGLPGPAAEVAADELAARDVLAAGEPLHFQQPLVGAALTSTLPSFALAARHRSAAELLGADGADDERIAAHLVLSRPAGDPWACEVLRRAARAALGRGDPLAATRLLERAAAEPAPPAERGRLLVELARAEAAAGLPSAIDAFERALDHVQDSSQRVDAWHGLSRLLYVREDHAGAAAAAARGLAELPEGDSRRERLLADELAGAILVPQLFASAAARTEALVGGAPPTEPALLAQLIIHQVWRGIRVGDVPELVRAAVAADPLVDPESRGFALVFVTGALNMIDAPAQAGALLDAGLERAVELGDPLAEVSLRCCRAWSRLYRGQLPEAAEDLEAVMAMNRLEWSSIDGLCGPPLVVLRLERGDLAGARDALRRAARGAQPGLPWFEGAVALAAGDAAAALAAFEAAGTLLDDMLGLRNPGVLPWRSGAALAAARLGRHERARELAAAEVEQARATGVRRALGIALRTVGLVTPDAESLEESVRVLERSEARLELARSLVSLGVAHRRARRVRDARAPLGRGLDLARECDATSLAEQALAELQAAGARPRGRPRAGAAALTASERRVAELAAAGQTTRQIAGALFLSPKTVEGHLTSAYRKLGVSSRRELAPALTPPSA
jgi:DNA-binding CsgD family transcriptional regulator